MGSNKVHAATVSSADLNPGAFYNTGNHTFNSGDLNSSSYWTLIQVGTSGSNWSNGTNGWINMATNGKNRVVWAGYHYAFDMRKSVSFSAGEKASGGSLLNGYYDLGDALGLIFSPVSADKLYTGGTGGGLGIKGLPNSVFAGRDFYYNSEYGDSTVGRHTSLGNEEGSTQVRIATTDASGNLIASGSSASGANPVVDAGAMPNGGESISLSWTALTDNGDGTVTGNMVLTINGKTVTYTNLKMQYSMSMGVEGITGGNYSTMSYNLSAGNLSASKGTDNVTVNYIDRITNKPLGKASLINANVGESIGVVNPSSGLPNDGNTYDYTPPTFPKYNLTSISAPVLVRNYFSQSEADPNVINVYYTPFSETATFKTYYTTGTPGTGLVSDSTTGLTGADPTSSDSVTSGLATSLPPLSTVTGYYGAAINNVPNLDIPEGYQVDYVVGPDGKSGKIYPDLTSALAANPEYDDPADNAWANYFMVYLAAKSSTANFTYKYVAGTRPNAPALSNLPSESGVTGGEISDSSKDWSALPTGATVQSVTGPDGVDYPTLSAALSAGKNKYYKDDSSAFTLNVVAPPVDPTLDSAPNLDFGPQTLKSGDASYTMTPSTDLEVTDDTYIHKGWDVTAEMVQQFTTDSSANPASAPQAQSFTLQENSGAAQVMTAQAGTGEGQWSLDFSEVTLHTNGAPLASGKNYQATIKWSLNDVPE